MTPAEILTQFSIARKAGDAAGMATLVSAILPTLDVTQQDDRKLADGLFWRAAEAGHAGIYAQLAALVPDYNPNHHLMFAGSGGDPAIMASLLAHPDLDPDQRWDQLIRSVLTGEGVDKDGDYKRLHPGAPDTLTLLLARPETKDLGCTHALWSQLGLFPRAAFLPAAVESLTDHERQNHPFLVVDAWVMTMFKLNASDTPDNVQQEVRQILLTLAEHVSAEDRLAYLTSEDCQWRSNDRAHYPDRMFERLLPQVNAHPQPFPLPIQAWYALVREGLGDENFPQAVAREREAELAAVKTDGLGRPRVRL